MRNDHDELLRLERICLEQAELCRDGRSRAAYLSMAENYRAAADSYPILLPNSETDGSVR
jgi:hypothetical protein